MRRLASVFSKRREDDGKRSWKSAKPPEADYSSLAQQHLLILSKNAMVPQLSVPPFVQHNLGPLFPRSVNRPGLPPTNTRVTMFRTHLVAHLANSDLDLDSILPFGHRPPPDPLFPPPPSFPDVSRPTSASKIFPASPGIRRWIARPCFEDRYVVYFPSPSGLEVRPVSAAAMAVAALEFSEHLDAMADPEFDHHVHSHVSNPDPAPSAPSSRNSYTPSPSPLRNQHNPTPNPEPLMADAKTRVKRVVRFAEDDSDGDDALPLHIVRMKKMREQKAKFLRQEQLRRTREEAEERRRREQEARRLEEEAFQREQRRQTLEKEKREREKVLYAETIAATRLRRETHKAGGFLSSNTINLLLPSSPSFTSLRDAERNKPPESRRLSQLSHDPPSSLSIPRRQASDSALPINSHAHTHYPSDSSPSSSRPPSMSHSPSPVSPGGHGHHSRPPSTHSANTSSSEEMRGSRRSSLSAAAVAAHSASSSAFGRSPIIASYPAWSGSNPNFQYIPPVPPFPDFVHDMPLLPPAAPFMKPSYNPRSSSRNVSPGPPSSSGSRRGSFTSSTERVNQIPASLSRNSSTQSLSPNPESSSVKPTTMHQQRGSGDSRNTTHTHRSRPMPITSRSQPTLSRGRPQQPIRSSTQYLQAPPPSTWTPLQNSLMQPMPMMMMVPAMVPAYPMNMNVNTNANGMMQQSNLRNGASGGGGGSTSSKTVARGWRQTQTIIS